jgi:cold shock CspA family protein
LRFAGRLQSWNDERGFGFIRPVDGGQDIFVHVSQLSFGQPAPDEVLTFEVGLNHQGKKKALNVRRQSVEVAGLAADVARSDRPLHRRPTNPAPQRTGPRTGTVRTVVLFALIVAVAGFALQRGMPRLLGMLGPSEMTISKPAGAKPEVRFQCDGRQHCSQMSSCEEATFFLQNCPTVKMDGDGDGVPCEQQHCGR